MATKYVDDLRRIIGIDEDQSSLEDAGTREAIPGKRGIAFYTSKNTIGTRGGTTGQTVIEASEGQNTTNKDTKAEGTSTNPNDPGGSIKSATDGTFSADDLLDGSDGPEKDPGLEADGLDTYFSSNGGSLNEITGLTDCASSTPFTIRTDGLIVPPDEQLTGSGDVLTPEWVNENTPPNKTGTVAGDIWRWVDGAVSYFSESYSDFYALQQSLLTSRNPGNAPYATVGNLVNTSSDGNGLKSVQPTYEDNAQAPTTIGSIINRITSSYPTPDATNVIIDTSPTESSFPVDGEFTLTRIDGKFNVGEFEPDEDVPAKYSTDSSKVDFCFGSGQKGSVEAAVNGGFMMYETSTEGGVPSGIVRVYTADGKLTAFTDSTGVQEYRPQ